MGGCDSKEKEELVDVEDDEYYKENFCEGSPKRVLSKTSLNSGSSPSKSVLLQDALQHRSWNETQVTLTQIEPQKQGDDLVVSLMQEVHRLRSERRSSEEDEVAKNTKMQQLLETTKKLAELNEYSGSILHSLKDGHVDEHGRLLILRAEEKMQNLDVRVKSQLLAADSVPTYRYVSKEEPISPRKAPSVRVSLSPPYSPKPPVTSSSMLANQTSTSPTRALNAAPSFPNLEGDVHRRFDPRLLDHHAVV